MAKNQEDNLGLGNDMFLMNYQRMQDRIREASMKQDRIFQQHLQKITLP
jgi:hypothetical protein